MARKDTTDALHGTAQKDTQGTHTHKDTAEVLMPRTGHHRHMDATDATDAQAGGRTEGGKDT